MDDFGQYDTATDTVDAAKTTEANTAAGINTSGMVVSNKGLGHKKFTISVKIAIAAVSIVIAIGVVTGIVLVVITLSDPVPASIAIQNDNEITVAGNPALLDGYVGTAGTGNDGIIETEQEPNLSESTQPNDSPPIVLSDFIDGDANLDSPAMPQPTPLQVTESQQPTSSESTQNPGSRRTTAYAAYYNALKAVVDERGVSWGYGVYNAQLLDFDNDGLPELVYAVAYGGNYMYVRVFGYSEGVVQYYEGLQFRGGGHPSVLPIVSLAVGGDKTIYVVDVERDYDRGSDTILYYTVKNGEWIIALSLFSSFDIVESDSDNHGHWWPILLEGFEWFVNGVSVDKDDYENAPANELGIVFTRDIPYYKTETVHTILTMLKQ